MIVDAESLGDGTVLDADLTVVGAGPAGIVTALEVARSGREVLLIESGQKSFRPALQELADAAEWNSRLHAPMSMTTRRQVGGASVIWGGRCVPYDPVDFDYRPFVPNARWPLELAELTPYYSRASDWLVCGRPVFDARQIAHLPRTLVPGLPEREMRTSALERWSLPTNFGAEYLDRIRRSSNVRLVTGLTCGEIVCRSAGHVDYLECRTLEGRCITATSRRYVVASGGLESTRLLLASREPNGPALGNRSGHLGRWYMGHVEGVVANVHFFTPPRETVFGYERDIDGVYVRRRFAFTREFHRDRNLPNIAAWLANPELPDARHRSGELSFAYLALLSPLGRFFAPDAQRLSLTGEFIPGAPYGGADKGPLRDHLENIVRDARSTARFVTHFGAKRFLARRRRVPGFFVYSRHNTYPLQYHGEHLPNPDSTVSLSTERDRLGMPKLRIDVRFSDDDVDGVVRAHRYWDDFLRRSACGRLEYLHDDVAAAVRARIGAGFHQIGTTRMSMVPADGVVDRNLAVHGVDNLFVVSSSTFPTSSQANSTFMIVVLAVRLGDRLRSLL